MQGGNVLAWPQNKCEKMNKNLQKKGKNAQILRENAQKSRQKCKNCLFGMLGQNIKKREN